jgi:dTDP-4-amino-4,6-dideoxygalactose transaminase
MTRGQIDKYSWVDLGSSYLPSEINAAFLQAQLDRAESITRRRLDIWDAYHQGLVPLEASGVLRRPIVPANCTPNAHMYYVLLAEPGMRGKLIAALEARGINAVSHYVPLHDSVGGRRFGRSAGPLDVTEGVADRLLRLPLWPSMEDRDVGAVIAALTSWAPSVRA